MIFHFTNKMIEKTNAGQLPVRNDVDPLGSWRVNIIQDERDKLVVFMNDATRYVILLDNPPLKNLEKLFSAFLDQLLQVMSTDQINTEVFLAYFNEFRGIDLAKNSDPKKTAEMIGSSVNVCDLWGISNDVRMSQYVNHLKLKSLGYHFPTASFMEALTRYDRPVRLTHAYDLLCVLQLKNGSARRKIRVSDYFTFDDLHRIIQAAFGWLDYHLYEFEFYHKKSSKRSILLDGYEDPDGDPNAPLARDYRLCDLFPEFQRVFYNYDFGDGWRIRIQLESEEHNCEEILPTFLRGSGDAPPEDVGGPWGFADFVEIVSNPQHEEYQFIKEWAEDQEWRVFDFDAISEAVESSLQGFSSYERSILMGDNI